MTISFFTALLAGFFSFLSPCVLPLVPAYVCYLAGASSEEIINGADKRALRRRVLLASLLFVFGFSVVFVLLGASASVAGLLLRQYQDILSKIAGAGIFILGLHFLGLFRLPFLNFEKRFAFPSGAGPFSAFLMGLAFAFGWTPCIGPVLAAILTLAAREESVGAGMLLLGAYSLGLGIPFVFAGIALHLFLRVSRQAKKALRWFETVAGLGLVITGFLFMTGTFTRLASLLIETFPSLGTLG